MTRVSYVSVFHFKFSEQFGTKQPILLVPNAISLPFCNLHTHKMTRSDDPHIGESAHQTTDETGEEKRNHERKVRRDSGSRA